MTSEARRSGLVDSDVVVIGSGSGGLTAALALARAGKRVAVFEQHTHAGGYTQSFSLDGFRFSPGVHYIGGLQPGGSLREIYEGLGIANDLVFLELNADGYDHAIIGRERFDIPAGRARYQKRLQERFPRESAGIAAYLDTVERISAELTRALPARNVWELAALPFRMPTVLRYGLAPLDRFLNRFTRDPLLRAILSVQAGDHGMAPSRAPAALHAGVASYYMNGGCYPRGGALSITNALASHIARNGGEVRVGTAVKAIEVRGGRVTGVRLADGTQVLAPVVISNADPGMTWGRLVAPEHAGARIRRRIRSLRYSLSTLSLFLGVEMDLRAAGLDSGNCWFSRTTDVEACYKFAACTDLSRVHEIPGLFLTVTTLKDPSARSDGRHTVEAICFASYDAFAKWRETTPGRRPDDYRRLKEFLAEKMLDAIEQFVPGIRGGVRLRALGTPLTNARVLAASRGGIYGIEKSVRNLGPFSFPIRTHIEGLFQCGASTIAPGILGVTTSGLAAAEQVLGCSRADLLNAKGQTLRVYAAEAPFTWPEELRPQKSAAA